MKKAVFTLILSITLLSSLTAQLWPTSLAGRWTFDNTSDLLHASIGNDLLLTGNHTIVPGAFSGDGAVSIGIGSYYTCTHGIPANGGGSLLNEYSVMWDVMITDPRVYHALLQTNMSNQNDGDSFINPNSQIGLAETGYSGFALRARDWYRIVLTVDNGSSLRYYVNGHQVLEGNFQTVDGRFSLDPTVLFFADDNSEDSPICVSQIAIFGSCLTASEVKGMGGFRNSDIRPYLQSPTPNSMIVNWQSFQNSSTAVDFGPTQLLGSTLTGLMENTGNLNWHTVKLTGLNPATRYYYRCRSGSDTSAVFYFRTPPMSSSTSGHIRIIKLGDSQDDAAVSSRIVDTICYLLKNLYGNEWRDSVNLIMHSGDITQDGSVLAKYMNEFFNPVSPLSSSVPVMVSIGNHEMENANYYTFMKYEDLTGNNEKYYSFILGNCQFISLNTNGGYNNQTQISWLQTQLNNSANNPDVDFVFEYNHHPAHSELWPDGNTSYVLNDILPVLSNYPKVILNTTGHSHNYENGIIMGTHNNNWDFHSVLSGGAGGPLDRWGMYANQTNYPEIYKSLDHYHFLLFDVNIGEQTVHCRTFSLGHNERPRNIELVDSWHRKLNQPAPAKPTAIQPSGQATATPVLLASLFSGIDSLMSSQFQVAPISGSFLSPLFDKIRNNQDFYNDSGAPFYQAINQHQGIDLRRIPIPAGTLITGQSYMWRMRYRDHNLRWSNWSDTLLFTVVNSLPDVTDFFADITSGYAPLTVQFTDLSTPMPFTWEWDFDNDGTTDNTFQDPNHTYQLPGVYTVKLITQQGAQFYTETKQQYITVLASNITENSKNKKLEIYPNPSNSFINVISETEIVKAELFSMSGVTMRRFTTNNMLKLSLDLTGLADGCYILVVNDFQHSLVVKK